MIANHALYFADLGAARRGDGAGVLPEHDAVVFDEAHRLEESAATWLGGRVSLARPPAARARRRARLPRGRAARRRRGRSTGSTGAGEHLSARSIPARGRRRLREPTRRSSSEHGLVLAAALGALAAALTGSGEDVDALARRALGAADDVEAASRPTTPTASSGPSPASLAWAPVDVSGVLRESLWESGPTAVLVSATLEPRLRPRAGSASTTRASSSLPSPFDFREQALLYVPRALPDPRARRLLDRLADEVVALCRLSAGRALVLTSSYRALDELVDAAARRGSRTRCSSRARRRASGCSSASATRSTRCWSRPRRSGRASTSRASRSRCS